MMEFLSIQKKKIADYLSAYLTSRGKDVSGVNNFGTETAADLSDFSTRGKMIRGALVYMGNEICGGKGLEHDVTTCAASVELFQSALLIHDDIMDRDLTRRGKPSLFAAYGTKYNQSSDAYHLGESLGICAGDISFFYAYEILSHIQSSDAMVKKMLSLFSNEMVIVCTAQMQDVLNGSLHSFPSKEEILKLYRFKTGRYTFSLPLTAGAVLSEASEGQIKELEEIGELMGIIFQIRDDELGLFGNEKKTGKTLGSDIMEGKKTIHMAMLRESLIGNDKEEFDIILSKSQKSKQNIEKIIGLLEKYNIQKKVDLLLIDYKDDLTKQITSFPSITESVRKRLQNMAQFITSRSY